MRKTKKLITDRIHEGKIYRYNGSNDDFISLHEIHIDKIHEHNRTRTVRTVIHKGVYQTDTINIPYFITPGKLYRCVKRKHQLLLIPYRAKRERKYTLQGVLIQVGYIGFLTFGFVFTFLMTYHFTAESNRKESAIISIGFLALGVICFTVGKIMEHKQHTREKEMYVSLETLTTEVAQ